MYYRTQIFVVLEIVLKSIFKRNVQAAFLYAWYLQASIFECRHHHRKRSFAGEVGRRVRKSVNACRSDGRMGGYICSLHPAGKIMGLFKGVWTITRFFWTFHWLCAPRMGASRHTSLVHPEEASDGPVFGTKCRQSRTIIF